MLQQGEYEDAKEELTEMAAFLGVQLVKYMGGEWYHYVNGDFESCAVCEVKTYRMSTANCLNLLLGAIQRTECSGRKNLFWKYMRQRQINPIMKLKTYEVMDEQRKLNKEIQRQIEQRNFFKIWGMEILA